MAWQKINDYYMQNDEYTISINLGSVNPYGLWKNNVNYGYFETQEALTEAYKKLKGEKNDRPTTSQ